MKAKLILLAAVVMIAGCAFGQEPVKMKFGPEKLEWRNSPGVAPMTIVASQDENGHWQLEKGMTLDDVMKVLRQEADRCEADKREMLDTMKAALYPAPKKSATTPKKAKPIKKPPVKHDKLTCGSPELNCTVIN